MTICTATIPARLSYSRVIVKWNTARSVLCITLAAAVAVFATLYAVAARIPYVEASSIGSNAQSFEELSSRFEKLTRTKGGVYAFEVLKRAKLPANTDTHLLGHAVGDVFYTQKGVAGIADCTQEFRNACSHTIVVGALNEFGPASSTLAMIDEACKKAPGGIGAYTMCYHGLGHGVFAYFGYDLNKTVEFCARTGTTAYDDEQFTQCVGGAIMELLSGGGHDHDAWLAARADYLHSDRPLTPCSAAIIPDKAKWFCYLYLTPRLFEVAGIDIGRPDPALFPLALSYCDAIPLSSARLREACYGGFGKDFLGFVADRDIRTIDQLPSGAYARAAQWCTLANPRDGREACIREALESVFWGGENDPSAAFRFCSVTPAELTEGCYKDLADLIRHYLQGEERARVCAGLPNSYQNVCSE